MKDKKFHWVNDDVKIDFKVPKALQILMEQCEQLDLEEDYAYFNYVETLDCDVKELVRMGVLTDKQWAIFDMRYFSE